MNSKKKIKRGCVISGGGSWGAYGAGTLARLNRDYDIVAGISTGALMSPLVALKKWDVLKDAYTSVDQNTIFDDKWYKPSPFTKNGKINIFAVLYALIFKENSIGTTKNLRKHIDKFLNQNDLVELVESNIEVIVGTQNLREKPSRLHYFSTNDWGVEDYKDWMWASASPPFLTELLNKEWSTSDGIIFNGQWTDGGLTESIAIDEAYKRGCQEIDVIIHKYNSNNVYEIEKLDTIADTIVASINALHYDASFEYFESKIKYLNTKGVSVNLWYLPRGLSKNSMIFNKEQMNEWWNEGFETAFDTNRIVIYEAK